MEKTYLSKPLKKAACIILTFFLLVSTIPFTTTANASESMLFYIPEQTGTATASGFTYTAYSIEEKSYQPILVSSIDSNAATGETLNGYYEAAGTMLTSKNNDTYTAGAETFLTNAILNVTDDVLGFNVVYTANADNAAIIDLTEAGITSLTSLKEAATTYAVVASLSITADGAFDTILITSVYERPKVGISWKSDSIGSDYKGFAEAYRRNGADPFFFPQFTSNEEAESYLADNDVNGVFMTGGSDVNPYFYGESELQTPHGSGAPANSRDISDIALIQSAIKMDIPLLGVCRGEQIFNVAMGGGLIQDIPYYLGQKIISGEIDSSRVTTVLSGRLPESDEVVADTGYTIRDFSFSAMGVSLGATYDRNTQTYIEGYGCDGDGHLRVWIDGLIHSGGTAYHELGNDEFTAINSDSKWMYNIVGDSNISAIATAHHQAVNPEKLGNGLTIVAHSSDGIIEGIEYQDNLFALGIQFHPERDALGDTRGVDVDQDICNSFLRALVDYGAIHNSYTGSYSKSLVIPVFETTETTETPVVTDEPAAPATADTSNLAWFIFLLITCSTGFGFISVSRIKKTHN